MPIYGKKEILVRRLENKDKRRHTYCGCLEKSGLRLQPEADHISNRYNSNLESFIGNIDATRQRSSSAHSSSLAGPASSGRNAAVASNRSKSLPPSPYCTGVSPSSRIEVESVSSDEDSARMEVDQDAVDMFPVWSENEEIRRDRRLLKEQQCFRESMQAQVATNRERRARSSSVDGAQQNTTSSQSVQQQPVSSSTQQLPRSSLKPSDASKVLPTAANAALGPAQLLTKSGPFSAIMPRRHDTSRHSLAPQRDSGEKTYSAALKSPPETMATASTAQSSVSSLPTPSGETMVSAPSQSSAVSAVTGKLLNTRPCQNIALDGVANYVAVTVHPSRSAAVVPPPPEWVFEGLLQAYHAFYKIDSSVKWYPTYNAEPGEEPTAPIDNPMAFPLDLDSLQMNWYSIDNPWELRTINPGEMDNRTGRERTYKSIFITVLMGSKFDLDHVLQLALPTLASKNVQVKRKDVDALKSKTLFLIMGSPLDFDPLAVCRCLHEALAKHEEWMQGNITYGYNAREYAGLELPPMVIVKRLPRMPESKDILPPEDIEVIQYLKSLRTMMHIEVSNHDQVRMRGLLTDFCARGKMNIITADADLLACVQSNNLEQG
jgi:hypothetical protein